MNSNNIDNTPQGKGISQPQKRTTYYLNRNQNNLERNNTPIVSKNPYGLPSVRGDNRLTGEVSDHKTNMRNDPKSVFNRQIDPVRQQRDAVNLMGKPSYHKSPKNSFMPTSMPINQTDRTYGIDPKIPSISAPKTPIIGAPKMKVPSQPNFIAQVKKEENVDAQNTNDYKYIDEQSGKHYGDNKLEEERGKKKKIYHKTLMKSEIYAYIYPNNDLEIEILGQYPIKIDKALQEMGFVIDNSLS